MIKKPNDWNNVQEYTEREKLPLDAYVCKVKRVAVQDNLLMILFDIDDGKYKGFYTRDFQNNQNADKKWKGILRVWLPTDDGSENDARTKKNLKGMITAFEKSNNGYTWNWDENTLVGKTVGVLYRNEEYDYMGYQGWSARPFRAISVESVNERSFKLPKDKPLANKPAVTNDGYEDITDDDDFPF